MPKIIPTPVDQPIITDVLDILPRLGEIGNPSDISDEQLEPISPGAGVQDKKGDLEVDSAEVKPKSAEVNTKTGQLVRHVTQKDLSGLEIGTEATEEPIVDEDEKSCPSDIESAEDEDNLGCDDSWIGMRDDYENSLTDVEDGDVEVYDPYTHLKMFIALGITD